jgi:hypothetical protein
LRTLLTTTSRMFLFLLLKYRLPRDILVNFRFVILVSSNVSRRLRVSLPMPWRLHSFLVMCCMFSIMPLFNYYSFRVLSFFFKLILTQRLGYLFPDLIGARSDRTSNFIFPSVSPEASVLAFL